MTDSPPVTVEQFLVEDGAVGTEEVYGVESLDGDGVLGRRKGGYRNHIRPRTRIHVNDGLLLLETTQQI